MKIEEGKRGENEYKAAGEILAAGFGWGIIGVFSRPLSEAGLSVVQITALRCVIVATSMALLLFCTDRDRFRIQIKDGWIFLGMGILSLVCFNVCYFITIEHATLAAASILLYTAPFFVLLMSAILFHEKMTKRKIAALLLAFAGCMLVSGFTGGQMSRLAVVSGIGSGICYALYSQVSPVYSCVLCVFGGSHQPDSLCKITGGVFEPDDLSGAFWQRAGAGTCIYLFSVCKLHTGTPPDGGMKSLGSGVL